MKGKLKRSRMSRRNATRLSQPNRRFRQRWSDKMWRYIRRKNGWLWNNLNHLRVEARMEAVND